MDRGSLESLFGLAEGVGVVSGIIVAGLVYDNVVTYFEVKGKMEAMAKKDRDEATELAFVEIDNIGARGWFYRNVEKIGARLAYENSLDYVPELRKV